MNPSRCFSTAPLFFEFPPSACCTSFVCDPGSSLALLRFFRNVTRAPEESWTPRSKTSDGELVLSFPDFSGALPLSLPHDPRREGGTTCLVALSAPFLIESFGGETDDETLPELADNHGTTRGTKSSVLQIILFPPVVSRGL